MQTSVGTLNRQSYIGSSDAAAIIGMSPWRTPLDVFLDKTQGQQEVTPEKAAIFKRGHRLEPYILDMLSEEHGYQYTARGARYQDKELPFLAAEIDAEAESGENVEAKSANFYTRGMWGEQHTDAVPVYYNAQAQHGMMVTGKQRTIFPVLVGVDDFRVYQVERDEEVIQFIRAEELKMWDRIQRNDPPAPTTVSDIERLFPWDAGTVAQATDEIRDAYLQLKHLKKRIKMMESDAEEVAARIKLFMGEHQVLQFGAEKLLTWKSQQTTRFNIELFRQKHPTIERKFTKTTTSRALRLK